MKYIQIASMKKNVTIATQFATKIKQETTQLNANSMRRLFRLWTVAYRSCIPECSNFAR